MAELQRNFVLTVSHEFRTPPDVIDGQIQRLIHMCNALPPEVLEKRCKKIRAAVRRMAHLMDHPPDSSRWLDFTASAAMRHTDFLLATLPTEVCEMHLEDTPSARIKLRVETDEPNIFFGDARPLPQTFSSLVDNAVKCSPPGVPVSVRICSDDDDVSVTVGDQGLGILERGIKRLSERYVRGSNVAGMVGASVGLYLVELVVGLHRGAITATSEEGKGSTFDVFLPRLRG